ncbi:M4 family metallopeptidase [Tumebacillus sp. DT12]|uniref:Neutral metalloproteinase n=1 Tax=Tumebacillus lacus TaxID=2995335 RepID=A0ABT3X101_9BACL|nr:M4 family metallopeptidase [Tumebacillus lacus]MCX7569648.1 M4 family metallopeptidase [Tumebacillus lacus]
MNKKLVATLVLSSLAASAFAFNAGAANDKQVLKDEQGNVHNVVGKLGKLSGKTAEERAMNALDSVKGEFGYAKAAGNFKVKKSSTDDQGITHTKLDQTINGLKVFGSEAIVHEANGELQGVTADFKALTANTDKASLASQDAIAKAVAHTGFTGELSEAAQSELLYFPQDGQAKLAYKIGVRYLGADEAGNWQIFVDAVSGDILDAINKIEHVVGTGTGVLGDTKSINTTLRNGLYYLEDQTKYMYTQKGSTIKTNDFRNGTGTQTLMSDSDNVWNTTSQRAGVDAHYYAGKVYDYYYNTLGRNSYDGLGRTIISGVHYSTNYNNAFWNGTQMTYGDGDGTTFRPLSGALDVVAHELTHAVTDYSADLVYSYQSGALNESWSDAMASVIDSNDWLIGEDVYTPNTAGDALRSMSDPNAYGDPDHMSEYVNTSSDNGGVHTNSGIPNKAFYNFATAIGSRDVAGKVWYRALTSYMTSSTNFSGARSATLQACAALYGSNSSYYTALQNAWTAVGI